MTILAIANAKGGVGKTTTALTLAAALAGEPSRGSVLLIDLDPGGGLTGILRRQVEAIEDSAFSLLAPPHADPRSLAQETALPGVDLIPSHPAMGTLDGRLSSVFEREFLLKRALEALAGPPTAGRHQPTHADQRVRPTGGTAVPPTPYSWVILDTGPYMGLLSINALTAAEAVLLPLPPEYVVLLGGKMLMGYVEQIRATLNPALRILGILPTMVDFRTRHAHEMLAQLRAVFGELVFEEVIPYTVRLKEAPILGASILEYEPKSGAAAAYRQLAEEVRTRCLASA